MGHVVSIELVLDEDTEARVRTDWSRLADAGLSSMAANPSASNRPHITLLVRPGFDDEQFGAATALLPLELTLAEPIVFQHGTRGVLARRVAASAELLELHRAVHAAVPEGEDAPHTRPGDWTPHITLARRLRLDALPQALDLLGDEHVGRAAALRRWDSASGTIRLLG